MPAFHIQNQGLNNVASGAGVAFATAPIAHSVGIFHLAWISTAGTPTVADNVSGTWTLRDSIITNGTTKSVVFTCLDMPGGATTVTPTLTGATFGGSLSEFARTNPGTATHAGATGKAASYTDTLTVTGDILLTSHFAGTGTVGTICDGSPGTWVNLLNGNNSPTEVDLGYLGDASPNSYIGRCNSGSGSQVIHLIATQMSALAVTRATRRLTPITQRMDDA